MDLPQGFDLPGSAGKVCHLKKSLYGLTQASRQWNQKFSSFLKRYNLVQSSADPCVFYSTVQPLLATTIFVDDGLAICSDLSKLDDMVAHLKQQFEITVGSADMYIGLHITRDRFHRAIYLDQARFIETFLAKYGFSDLASVNTPADPNVRLQKPLPDDELADTNFPYQSCVGSLLYVQTWSRPDIVQAVTTVSQYSSNYRKIHCTAVT